MSVMDIHLAMIVGKYFKSAQDYINFMRLHPKYKELVEMYKCNPISDASLFPNINTQHFYKASDFSNVVPGLYRYVYWGDFTHENEMAVKRVNARRYKVNEYDDKELVRDKCISRDMNNRSVKSVLPPGFRISRKIFDSKDGGFNPPALSGNVVEVFQDSWNNRLAILRGVDNITGEQYIRVPCILQICYIDNENNVTVYKCDDRTCIRSDSNHILLTLDMCRTLVFESKCVEKPGVQPKMWMIIKNRGFSYEQLRSMMFGNSIVSQVAPNTIRFLVRRYSVYCVEDCFDDSYYNRLVGCPVNVLFDTWKRPYVPDEYNMGFLRYVYFDHRGNIMAFSVFPTEIIVTTRIDEKVAVFKPKTRMTNFIEHFGNGIYYRYNFCHWVFYNYYDGGESAILGKLRTFIPVRLLVTTNRLTRCSCVRDGKYFLRVINGNYENY